MGCCVLPCWQLWSLPQPGHALRRPCAHLSCGLRTFLRSGFGRDPAVTRCNTMYGTQRRCVHDACSDSSSLCRQSMLHHSYRVRCSVMCRGHGKLGWCWDCRMAARALPGCWSLGYEVHTAPHSPRLPLNITTTNYRRLRTPGGYTGTLTKGCVTGWRFQHTDLHAMLNNACSTHPM